MSYLVRCCYTCVLIIIYNTTILGSTHRRMKIVSGKERGTREEKRRI